MTGLICCFSLSGNTRAVCETIRRKLASVIELTLYDIAAGEYPDFNAYDLVGFATFTDELQLPDLMRDYIQYMSPVSGKNAFVLNTYGSIPGKTILQFQSLLQSKGFTVIDGLSLHTPENYPPMINSGFGFGNQPSDRQLRNLAAFIGRLRENIESIAGQKPANVYPIKVGVFNRMLPIRSKFLSRRAMGSKRLNDETCLKCGLCVKICPYRAVGMSEYPEFDEAKCHFCWACYNHCPTGSIHTKGLCGEGRCPKPLKQYLERLEQL